VTAGNQRGYAVTPIEDGRNVQAASISRLGKGGKKGHLQSKVSLVLRRKQRS